MSDYIETWDHKIAEKDPVIDKILQRGNELWNDFWKGYREERIEKLQKENEKLRKELAVYGNKHDLAQAPVPEYFELPCSCWYKGGLFDGDID